MTMTGRLELPSPPPSREVLDPPLDGSTTPVHSVFDALELAVKNSSGLIPIRSVERRFTAKTPKIPKHGHGSDTCLIVRD